MNISNTQIQQAYALHLHKVYGTQSASSRESIHKPDELILSTKARDIQQARASVESMPAIRADLVSSLRSRIESGEYRINAVEIADAILG